MLRFKLFLMALLPLLMVFEAGALAQKTLSRYKEIYNFGTVAAASPIRHVFTLTNPDDTPISIENVSVSCEGVQILSYPRTIGAQKKGALEVRLLPARSGPVACDITVETEDSKEGILLYRFKGKIEGEPSQESGRGTTLSPLPGGLITRKVIARDDTLTISVDSVLKKRKEKQDITLVDVRDERAFERCRIPGSIQVPLYALKTKGYLKSMPVVLVAEGFEIAPLEAECRRLRSEGFAVWILDGGLSAWKEKGAPLEGPASALSELNRISPHAYFEERHYAHWLVLSACESKREEASLFVPESVALGCTADSEGFRMCIEASLGKRQSDAPRFVLIFNENGTDYDKMEKALHGANLQNVFYLEGGLKAYKGFLEQQSSLIRAKDLPRRSEKRCPACP